MSRTSNESIENFTKRVQSEMCQKLNIRPVNYTYKDKLELIKKLHPPSSTSTGLTTSDRSTLTIMMKQVKEVLPYVPNHTILQDLGKPDSLEEQININFRENWDVNFRLFLTNMANQFFRNTQNP